MENYEQMLEEAYANVKEVECGERFEVPKVAGHHEGTKTVITNFFKITACIRRSPEHLIKYLGKELASNGEISGERLILSRKLSSKEINEKIEKYINLFVICPRCKKPDTELVNEGNKLFLKCLACGEKHEVHKL